VKEKINNGQLIWTLPSIMEGKRRNIDEKKKRRRKRPFHR